MTAENVTEHVLAALAGWRTASSQAGSNCRPPTRSVRVGLPGTGRPSA